MIVHRIEGPPPGPLAGALRAFERCFRYPLGPERSFHIEHGDDYPRFFRAIGPTACLVAERGGEVLGTLAVSLCSLLWPDGSLRRAAYVGDLKLSATTRSGFLLRKLALAATDWVRPFTQAAFSVVMDGTRVVPTAYTGRVGIPTFQELGKVQIWRLECAGELPRPDDQRLMLPARDGPAHFRRLSRGRYAPLGGEACERSETSPLWLVHPEGLACARLEDTRRAKRLFADDGTEMKSAHLSCFAWETPAAGAELLRAAVGQSARRGFPALFVSVTPADAEQLRPLFGDLETVVAPATIYGMGLEPGQSWNIHTAEV